MRAFLLFLSSLIAVSVFGQECCPDTIEVRRSDSGVRRCAVTIDTGKATLSGIMITKEESEQILGSIVNEFGISAMDFVYDRRKEKLRLEHVVGFLDKWYIRKVIGGDLKHTLHILYSIPQKENKKYKIQSDGATTTVINTKRKISYTFSPIKETQQDETPEQSL